MERKRTTAFNAYCSEKRKENPSAGFRIQLWAREWQQLSCEVKKYYKKKAQITREKYGAVNCLHKIKKLINSLKDTNDRKDVGIQAIGLVILKNGVLGAYGFGGLQNCLSDGDLHLKLLGLSTESGRANIKKSTIEELRAEATGKMSKIAKEQLGLNQFPYKRVQKGEFIVSGVPPSLLPLRPAGKLAIKELNELLAAHISVSRAPAAVQAKVTDVPQEAVVQVTDLPQEADVHVIDLPQEAVVQVTDLPQEADVHVIDLPQEAVVQVTDLPQEADVHVIDLPQEAVVQVTDLSQESVVQVTDLSREAVRDLNLPPAGHKRLAKIVRTSKAENKAKKPRKEWDEEAMKAVEELLHGPLPGLAQLEELKVQIPALAKFSALEIYLKLNKRK